MRERFKKGERRMSEDEVEKVAEILDVISGKLPTILNTIKSTFLSEEAGRDFGKAVGAFYKELVASGIPSEEALRMAQSYVWAIQDAVSQSQQRFTFSDAGSGRPGRSGWPGSGSGGRPGSDE